MKYKFLAFLKKYTEEFSLFYNAFFYIIKFSLLFGGVIVISYLLHIRFLPALNVENASSLIILSATMGLIILIISFVILIFAPFLFRQLLKEQKTFNILVKDKSLYSKIRIRDEDFSNSDRARIIFCYILSMSAIINLLIATSYFKAHYIFKFLCLSGFLGILIIPILYSTVKYLSPVKKRLSTKERTKKFLEFFTIVLKTYIILSAAGLMLFIGISFITKLQDKDFFIKTTLGSVEEVIILFSFVSSCCVTSFKDKPYNLESLFISCIMMFAIIFPTLNLTDNYCGRIMAYLKVGNMRQINLIVSNKACVILYLSGYPIACNKSYKAVRKIDVLWRLGEYYLIYTINRKNQVIKKYVIIPSSEVWLNDDFGESIS